MLERISEAYPRVTVYTATLPTHLLGDVEAQLIADWNPMTNRIRPRAPGWKIEHRGAIPIKSGI
jgi:hypothetical protein